MGKWRLFTLPLAILILIFISGSAFALYYISNRTFEPTHPETTQALWNLFAGLTPQIQPHGSERSIRLEKSYKPSLALLPFVDSSGDPQQAYFSDGISEDLVKFLYQFSDLMVVSPRSAFKYKGSALQTERVAHELGVRYVVDGAIEKKGEKVQIAAKMLDTEAGTVIWQGNYERNLEDISALRDDVTKEILGAINPELQAAPLQSPESQNPVSPDAYDRLLQGLSSYNLCTEEGNRKARLLLNEAVTADPDYAKAYALLASTHVRDIWFGWSQSPEKSLERSKELAQKALGLDEKLANAHAVLGQVYLLTGQYTKAISQGERAVKLEPGSADVNAYSAMTLLHSGQHEKAIEKMHLAMRLNPFYPLWYLPILGKACFLSDRLEESIAAFETLLEFNEFSVAAHMGLAAAYGEIGKKDRAEIHVRELLRLDPTFNLGRYAQVTRYHNPEDTERELLALTKAGIKC